MNRLINRTVTMAGHVRYYLIMPGIMVCMIMFLFSCGENQIKNVSDGIINNAGAAEENNNYDYSGVYRITDKSLCSLVIEIRKDNSDYVYSIHGSGEKSSGKVTFEKDVEEIYLTFTGTVRSGDKSAVTGAYADHTITIQNYGNSMNEYLCFKQCDAKYLQFVKH